VNEAWQAERALTDCSSTRRLSSVGGGVRLHLPRA
jgi:hypothetical protein